MIKTNLITDLSQETRIESVDLQYDSLRLMVEELSGLLDTECEYEKISQLFYKLIHINTHFFMQEQITLAKYNYPELAEIKGVHQAFIDKVMDGRERLNSDTIAFCSEMLDFINVWLQNYLLINSRAVRFLLSKNVS